MRNHTITTFISTWLLFSILLFALPAEARVVTLLNGDQLSGELKSENETSLILHHAVLGDITIPKKQIQASPVSENQAAAKSAAAKTAAAKEPEAAPEVAPKTAIDTVETTNKSAEKQPGLFGFNFTEGWKSRLALGIKGENGNDTSMDSSISFETAYTSDMRRFSIKSAYYYETEDKKKDTSKGHVNIVNDWLMPNSDWFFYTYFRYEQDSFESWKQRVSLSGGPGYDLYNTDTLRLSGRAGLGFSRSWGTEDEFDIEGQLGLEWHWKPAAMQKQTLSYQVIVYPLLNDFGEYRTWMEGKWRLDLGLLRGLGVEVGFEHDYESRKDITLEDERYYDLLYFGRLGLDF